MDENETSLSRREGNTIGKFVRLAAKSMDADDMKRIEANLVDTGSKNPFVAAVENFKLWARCTDFVRHLVNTYGEEKVNMLLHDPQLIEIIQNYGKK